ncbi:MAG: hypothetical protein V4509_00660 [Patescibacteria group bacterium]
MPTIIKVLTYNTPFQKGRAKMRFLKLVVAQEEIVNKSRVERLNELANKDEKTGKPVIQPGGAFDLSQENLTTFNTDFQALMLEDCLIDIPDAMKPDMQLVKQMINESTVMLDNREILVMEEVMEAMNPTSAPVKAPVAKKTDGK